MSKLPRIQYPYVAAVPIGSNGETELRVVWLTNADLSRFRRGRADFQIYASHERAVAAAVRGPLAPPPVNQDSQVCGPAPVNALGSPGPVHSPNKESPNE